VLLTAQRSAVAVTAVGLGAVAAAANMLGGLVITHRDWERRYVRYFLALGAGFMLGTTLLEMLPESLRLNPERGPMIVVAGFLLVHLAEHAFIAHFHFGEETHTGEFAHAHLSYSVLVALSIHAFFDGVAIGSGFLVSPWLGWVIFLAVVMHKIPEGFTVASVMLAAGQGARVAFASAAAVGVASILGVLVMMAYPVGLAYGLPLSAGATLYVAGTDLLPEVNREPGIRLALLVFLGVGLLLLLIHLFKGAPA